MSLHCRFEGADGERWHLPVSALIKCDQKQDSCDSVSFCTDSFSCSTLFPLCKTEYLEVKKKKRVTFLGSDLLSQSRERLCFSVSLGNTAVIVMTL